MLELGGVASLRVGLRQFTSVELGELGPINVVFSQQNLVSA